MKPGDEYLFREYLVAMISPLQKANCSDIRKPYVNEWVAVSINICP